MTPAWTEEVSKHKNKWIFAKCGDEMNPHADKLVYPVTAEDVQKVDDDAMKQVVRARLLLFNRR